MGDVACPLCMTAESCKNHRRVLFKETIIFPWTQKELISSTQARPARPQKEFDLLSTPRCSPELPLPESLEPVGWRSAALLYQTQEWKVPLSDLCSSEL